MRSARRLCRLPYPPQVSPHEFVQAVRNASKKRFTADAQVGGRGVRWGAGFGGGGAACGPHEAPPRNELSEVSE